MTTPERLLIPDAGCWHDQCDRSAERSKCSSFALTAIFICCWLTGDTYHQTRTRDGRERQRQRHAVIMCAVTESFGADSCCFELPLLKLPLPKTYSSHLTAAFVGHLQESRQYVG